ncbi:MAG: hypothetical protein ACE5JD_14160 [Candidatus Methylomirabilia bacterium]
MVEGTIKKLDLSSRSAVVELSDGKELSVKFPERVNIEVAEPETMGTMGGSLEDLQEGFLVELELEHHSDGSCSCASLVCVS